MDNEKFPSGNLFVTDSLPRAHKKIGGVAEWVECEYVSTDGFQKKPRKHEDTNFEKLEEWPSGLRQQS